MEFDKGACPMLATETGFTVRIGKAVVASNNEPGRLDDRGASPGGQCGLRGGRREAAGAADEPTALANETGGGGPHASP